MIANDLIPLPVVKRLVRVPVGDLRVLCEAGYYKTARRTRAKGPAAWVISRRELVKRHLA